MELKKEKETQETDSIENLEKTKSKPSPRIQTAEGWKRAQQKKLDERKKNK